MPNIVVRGITGLIYVLSVIAAIFIHPIVCVIYFFVIAMLGQNEFYQGAANTKRLPLLVIFL